MELNKIYNLDCLEGMKQLEDDSVDLIITDPPYGIDFQSAWRIENQRFDKLEGDDSIDVNFIKPAFRVLKRGGGIVCFHSVGCLPRVVGSNKKGWV